MNFQAKFDRKKQESKLKKARKRIDIGQPNETFFERMNE